VQREPESKSGTALRILWIARYVPYPADAGAKVYSAKLAEALASAGNHVRFLGFGSTEAVPAEVGHVDWVEVPGTRRSEIAAVFSRLPNAAAVDATPQYRRLLETQLDEQWDAIVLDGYGTGWALDRCLAYRYGAGPTTVLVHVSHNHEGVVWRDLVREARGSLPRRMVLRLNAIKVQNLERRVVRGVDLLTTITDEDGAALTAPMKSSAPQTITLTPGYAGEAVAPRNIDERTPRRVAIVGSFHWVMKQENLRRFVEIADPVFAANDVQLDIIGDVPEGLRLALQSKARATQFHGFVADDALEQLLSQARMAVVPELIGGGFKLKFLDYLFGRVPIATLAAAAAGVPRALQAHMIVRSDLESLTAAIVADIDRFDVLNRRQESALEMARALFRWQDRGVQLSRAISRVRQERNTGRGERAEALKAFSASTFVK
jgi:glycosyltransferase involved in cell wall biosynthesis